MATITPEEAFDMALMAFGSGAGGLYVKPKVAKMLRTKLFDNFTNEISQNPSQWEKSKIFLLECARCIDAWLLKTQSKEGPWQSTGRTMLK
jgi:hypothetical protein